MSKICTSLEQSKKLIELGIDINTADLTVLDLPIQNGDRFKFINNKLPGDIFPSITDGKSEKIPAWSLTALLGLMPKLYEFENDTDDGGCQPNLCKGWDNNQWHVVYRSSIHITDWYDDPIDAAFEMICWLKENGKI